MAAAMVRKRSDPALQDAGFECRHKVPVAQDCRLKFFDRGHRIHRRLLHDYAQPVFRRPARLAAYRLSLRERLSSFSVRRAFFCTACGRHQSSPAGATNVDQVKDYSPSQDTIQLENSIFTKFGTGTTGTINSAYFRANATGLAQDSNDYLVYETDTGKLFYDSNGSAAGGSVQFAQLGTNLALTYADYVLI